jgi:hypothetical protein
MPELAGHEKLVAIWPPELREAYATHPRLYEIAALKAACSLAASSCETEVFKILPPIPLSSLSILFLSGDGLLTSTKRAELPGISVPANSFMK